LSKFDIPFKKEKKKIRKHKRDRFIDMEDIVLKICKKTRIRKADVREVLVTYHEVFMDHLLKGYSIITLEGTHYTFKNSKNEVKPVLKYKRKIIGLLNKEIN
jgi:hypothetical protein